MSHKIFDIDDIGSVRVHKHKRAKAIRLRVSPDGDIKATIPYWLPYAAGVRFILSKQDWVKQQLPAKVSYAHDDKIGKKHTLVYKYNNKATKPRVRIVDNRLLVEIPFHFDQKESILQEKIQKTAEKALRSEAKDYLPHRLRELATSHNFQYNNVRIKKMKSRWGSCSSNKDISLNLYLMQLEDDLIDYVLLHELLHTRIAAHGKIFWQELAEYVPNLTDIRKRMRKAEPRIMPR